MENFLKKKNQIKLKTFKDNIRKDQPIRLLIIGSSGSGKTTLLLNFIYDRLIPYNHLYIFSKSLEQNAYTSLQKRFKNIESKLEVKISTFSCDEIVPLNKFKQICNDCWKENYGFLTINLLLKPNEGKYMNRFLDINI